MLKPDDTPSLCRYLPWALVTLLHLGLIMLGLALSPEHKAFWHQKQAEVIAVSLIQPSAIQINESTPKQVAHNPTPRAQVKPTLTKPQVKSQPSQPLRKPVSNAIKKAPSKPPRTSNEAVQKAEAQQLVNQHEVPQPEPTSNKPANHGATTGPTVVDSTQPPATTHEAVLLNNPKPLYPPASRRFGEEGQVVLRLLVLASGEVAKSEVATSSGYPRLDRAAQQAAIRWAFQPAFKNGMPIDNWQLQPITFTLY